MTTERAVAAEQEAIDADLKHRLAKASRFIELIAIDGMVHPVAFKHLDADPVLADLERQARYASAEARAAWITANRTPTEETSP